MCSGGRLTAAVDSRQLAATIRLPARPPAKVPANFFTPRPLDCQARALRSTMVAEFNPDGARLRGTRRLLQQPEYRDAVLGSHEYLAVGNGRRDELVAGAELIAVVG